MGDLSTATRVFFSFPHVSDPARHRDYNIWHVEDHQPENRALVGVMHGDRWVRTPACRQASPYDADPELTQADYVAMYWFAEPAATSIAEWTELSITTGERGRRQDLGWTERPFMGFFHPLQGYAAPGVPIKPAAIPYRAHRGVVVDVHRVPDPTSAGADAAMRTRYDEELPQVLATPGVIGAWTFGSRQVTAPRLPADTGWQVTVTWCSEDPATVAAAMPPASVSEHAELVLRTPLETIGPDRDSWTWFD